MITTVTITGADDSIAPERLFELSVKYPFVEWGILMSRSRVGTNRYPSMNWIKKLAELRENGYQNNMAVAKIKFSCHLCGAYVRELLTGSDNITTEIGPPLKIFDRIQINKHNAIQNLEADKMVTALQSVLYEDYVQYEFIFQSNSAKKYMLDRLANAQIVYSILFDLSGGKGILPAVWPEPIPGIKCGYAGGLSPDNLEKEIELIEKQAGEKEIWIDMESHVRTNEKFDLQKVERVLEICVDHL